MRVLLSSARIPEAALEVARALSVGLALLALGGCGMSDADGGSLPVSGSGGASLGGQANMGDLPTSLTFNDVPPLPARAQVTLRLQALPAKVYHVRFALPTSNGDPLDAVLDRAEADTDASGYATVQLTAPSATTSFDVRATVGGFSTSLAVSVKDTGFASVQVQPRYSRSVPSSALRDITTWIATAHPDKTCADVPGVPPDDGPLAAPPAAKAQAPVIVNVPAGTKLAITLRSGHFVGGCTSVQSLPAGPADAPQVVEVAVLNRPIDLSASSLSFSLGLNAPEATWSTSLESTGDAVAAALLGTSTDDVDALLDAMRDASGADVVQTFETTRKTEDWDGKLRAQWGPAAATKLRTLVGAWLATGRKQVEVGAHLLEGSIDPVLQPDALDQSSALLTLHSAAGVDANKAGFVSPAHVSWSANADDTVLLGTDVYVVQSRFATALGEAAALLEVTDAQTAAEALATELDCASIGSALAYAGVDTTLAYADCDGECVQSLCETAAKSLWQRGADATSLSVSLLSITGTGTAHVGDAAEVAGMGGTWIGDLKAGSSTSRTGGTLTAAAPPAP